MNKRQAKKFYKKQGLFAPHIRYRYKKTIFAAYQMHCIYLFIPVKHNLHSFMNYMRAAISLKEKYRVILFSDYFVSRNRYAIMKLEEAYFKALRLCQGDSIY